MNVFRSLLSVMFLLCCSSFVSATEGGHWNIAGTIVHVEPGEFSKTCEVANLELRFRSRWANGQGCAGDECPWGPTWGKTRTNSQGQFSKQSLAFANKGRQRDVLIEYRLHGTWAELTVLSDIGEFVPHQVQGNTWVFNVGNIETDKFECGLELVDAERPEPKITIDDSALGEVGKSNPGEKNAGQACGNIDLEIVNTVIRRRSTDEVPGHVAWEVTVRNNGTDTYPGTGKCKTSVRLELYVGNNVRGYDRSIYEAIPPGETRTFTSISGNFGNNTSELAANYNVLFTVDPDNELAETNEQNNTQPGCYAPLSENYQEGSCSQEQVKSSGANAENIAPHSRLRRGRTNRWTIRRN